MNAENPFCLENSPHTANYFSQAIMHSNGHYEFNFLRFFFGK